MLNNYFRRPEWLAFKSKNGKLKFSEGMRQAFGDCISNLIPVPVEGLPGDDVDRYVIETDITPDQEICKGHTFEYCNFNGNTQCYIRVGSSNIKREQYVDNTGNSTFETAVQKSIERRTKADLRAKKEELDKKVASLEQKAIISLHKI